MATKDPFRYFRIEAAELLQQLGQGALDLEKDAAGESLPRLLRLAHTLKGAARVVKLPEIADSAHRIETALAPWRDTAAAVPREAIDAVLAQIDRIEGHVKALAAPVPADAPAASAQREQAAGEAPRALRAEAAELDQLLDGVGQAHSQLSRLQESCEQASSARQLTQRLHAQLVQRRGREGGERGTSLLQPLSLCEELQRLVDKLERRLAASTEQIDRELRQLRDGAEQLRLVPAAVLFTDLERTARDAAQMLGRQVQFEGRGGEVRLDAQVLGQVQAALVQMVRNAVAHGIEPPAQRAARQKPPVGVVRVEALRSGRRVVFRCSDDGAGIDLAAVRAAALRKGDLVPGDDDELLKRLLRGGLSTAESVTEVAGRGIGLDVARECAERLGGDLKAHTAAGQGTTLELAVPLSIASIEVLLVDAGANRVALPLDAVRATRRITSVDIARNPQGDTLLHGEHALPHASLAQLLDPASIDADTPRRTVMVLEQGGVRAALGVDRLLGMATIVLRPLPELAPDSPLVAGVAMDIEGRPQLVLDPTALIAAAAGAGASAPAARAAAIPLLVIDDSLTTRMLEQSILESAGYEVHTAVSAEDGLDKAKDKAKSGPFALILVDVEMPGMDGFEFIERIRADADLRDVPAMLVTSRASPQDLQRGREVGAQAHIAKHEFAQNAFLEKVRELVQLSAARRGSP